MYRLLIEEVSKLYYRNQTKKINQNNHRSELEIPDQDTGNKSGVSMQVEDLYNDIDYCSKGYYCQ